MTIKEEFIRKWEVDLVICLKRFKVFSDAVKTWNRSGGSKKNGLIFNFLDLEGNDNINLLPHPYNDYTNEEKKVFEQCFGIPLEVPKKLMLNISLIDFQKEVDKRQLFYEECLSFTPQSRFRNFHSSDKKNDSKIPRAKKGVSVRF